VAGLGDRDPNWEDLAVLPLDAPGRRGEFPIPLLLSLSPEQLGKGKEERDEARGIRNDTVRAFFQAYSVAPPGGSTELRTNSEKPEGEKEPSADSSQDIPRPIEGVLQNRPGSRSGQDE